MNEQPSPGQLMAHQRRVVGMLADYECVGELLLVGLALARAVDLNDPPFRGGELTLGVIADRVYGGGRYLSDVAYPRPRVRADARPRARILDVLRVDIRRYEPTDEYNRVRCGRPMEIREDGRCGRAPNSNYIRRFTDPATGLREYVAACSYPAHRAWWMALREDNKRQLAVTPPPVPPANVGGVLDRHIPEIDWYGIYRFLDPDWTPPPEAEAWTAPKLILLTEEEPAPAGETPVDEHHQEPPRRPKLTVLPGGWR